MNINIIIEIYTIKIRVTVLIGYVGKVNELGTSMIKYHIHDDIKYRIRSKKSGI